MLALLAPSKTQNPRTCGVAACDVTTPHFMTEAIECNNALRALSDAELQKQMKLSPRLLEQTKEKISAFKPPFTTENSAPALFTFQGDSYDALTPESWTPSQLAHAQKHLAMLSGHYGLLRPLDLMQPYRLEMGLKLKTARGNNLYQFWSDSITQRLNATLQTHADKALINLASNEYSKAINPKLLEAKFITITFQQIKEGVCKTIPIYAKRARGAMANFLVKNQLESPDDLKQFSEANYGFIPKESSDNHFIFRCNLDT